MSGDILNFALRALIILGIAVLIDIYFYQAITTLIKDYSPAKRSTIKTIYWSLTGFVILVFIAGLIWPWPHWPKALRLYTGAVIVILFLSKVSGSFFLLIDDFLRLGEWFAGYIKSGEAPVNPSRNSFIMKAGIIFAGLPFVGLIYGMVRTAFDFKVRRKTVVLPNLPDAFDGLKIAQISDIHTGSFSSIDPVEKGVKLLMEQKPDIIFFTGDLVNNVADEVEEYIETLSKLKAPLGVFSVLGNHDYGDYMVWESASAKKENLLRLKEAHKRMGWQLLLNESIRLNKNEQEIGLIGVENWGRGARWPKYGNLDLAKKGVEDTPVKLLLSHDPSHWDAVIRKEHSDIDITFSGHTHGFQFGVDIPGLKWSPSQFLYPQWAGLYKKAEQYIYVNRGFGFLGYPGRVGIKPEITILELRKQKV